MPEYTEDRRPSTDRSFRNVDVLIVGSGAAGLTAALRLYDLGLRSLIIEKASTIGGTSCYSGGSLWIPNNHVARAAHGQGDAATEDSVEDALRYLNATVLSQDSKPGVPSATSLSRLESFVANGPRMVSFLESLGFRWRLCEHHPDCDTELPGGRMGGRSIESEIFDLHRLGKWQFLMRKPLVTTPPIYCHEARLFMLTLLSLSALWRLIQIFVLRWGVRLLRGQKPVTLGQALVGQLLHLCLDRPEGITIKRQCALQRLVVSELHGQTNGSIKQPQVQGAMIRETNTSQEYFVSATRGIVLCAGGFAANQDMREKHLRHPTNSAWSLASTDDQGDAIKAGTEIGASTASMDLTWGTPVMLDPSTQAPKMLLYERCTPHCLMVDSSGSRFLNEAAQYCRFVDRQYTNHKHIASIPAWMILDTKHRNRYPLGICGPGFLWPLYRPSPSTMISASSLADLANKLNVPSQALERTVAEFNALASAGGIDSAFCRGQTAYEQYYAPLGSLGTVEQQPFYGFPVYPGDIGTRGGLLTDENSRVISTSGNVIAGLYAAGNTAASWMGSAYPGQGSTLGPGLTAAFVAATHLAENGAD